MKKKLAQKNQKIKYNVLAVGCHPDDIELGCGGTIQKHIERGDKVYALILTRGQNGQHNPEMTECYNSLRVLGIKDVFFGDFIDGFVPENQESVNFIESIINRHKINRVYTHYPHDRHQDHRKCSLIVSAAARKISDVLLYQGPSTNVPFEPHYFVELSEEHLKKKIKALENYKTQIEKGIVNLEWIEGLAKVNGFSCRTKYAEAFALNHILQGGKDV